MTTDLRGKCKVPSHHEIKTLASSHCLTPLTCLIFPHPFVCIPLPKSPLYHLLFCFPLLLFSHYHRFLIVPPVVCLFKKLLLKCNFGIFKLKLSSFFLRCHTVYSYTMMCWYVFLWTLHSKTKMLCSLSLLVFIQKSESIYFCTYFFTDGLKGFCFFMLSSWFSADALLNEWFCITLLIVVNGQKDELNEHFIILKSHFSDLVL